MAMPSRDGPKRASSGQASRLLSLPQELQDIIFDFAYPRQDGVIFYDRDQWTNREKEARRRDTSHVLRPFPAPKVDEFMVSRQYFESASRIWTANQHITCERTCAFYMLPYNTREYDNGIIRRYATSVTWQWIHPTFVACGRQNFPSLRHLSARIGPSAFDAIEPKFPWTHKLADHDLDIVARYLNLDKLHGLRSLELIPDTCYYAATAGEKQRWVDNIHGLEAYLKPFVTRKHDDHNITKESPESASGPTSIAGQAPSDPVVLVKEALIAPKRSASPSKRSLPVFQSADDGAPKLPTIVQLSTLAASDTRSPGGIVHKPAIPPLSADSGHRRRSDNSGSDKVDGHGTKRISGVRNKKQRKRACMRQSELSSRIVEHLTSVYLQRRTVVNGAARRLQLNRQKPSKSAIDLLSVAAALSEIVIPDFGTVRSDAAQSEKGLQGSLRESRVLKPAVDEHLDNQSTRSRLPERRLSPHEWQHADSIQYGEGSASSSRQEFTFPDEGHTVRVSIPGTRLQHKPIDISHGSSSSKHAQRSAEGDSVSSPHDVKVAIKGKHSASSSSEVQTSKLGMSEVLVTFEVTPSDSGSESANYTGKAETQLEGEEVCMFRRLADDVPALSMTIGAEPEILPSTSEIDKRGVSRPFTFCLGAVQEILPATPPSLDKSCPLSKEIMHEKQSARQRSSLDAMQDLVRKEKSLLGKALLLAPSPGPLDANDIPDTIEEAMALCLEDSRSFLQWVLDAKKIHVTKSEYEEEEVLDSPTDPPPASDVKTSSRSLVSGMKSTATVARNIEMVICMALIVLAATCVVVVLLGVL